MKLKKFQIESSSLSSVSQAQPSKSKEHQRKEVLKESRKIGHLKNISHFPSSVVKYQDWEQLTQSLFLAFGSRGLESIGQGQHGNKDVDRYREPEHRVSTTHRTLEVG